MNDRDKKYNLWARKYPAIISLAFPTIYILLTYQKNEVTLSDAKYIANLIISACGILPALFFLYTFILRDIAKIVPEKLFKITRYPTTYLLSDKSEELTSHQKQQVKDNINRDFSIDLSQWQNGSKEFNRHAQEAVTLIREKTRENAILFEFNCIYGFYRNMTAGFLLNLIFASLLYFIPTSDILPYMAGGIPTVLLFFTILCGILCYINGTRYAKRLYIVYLSTNNI